MCKCKSCLRVFRAPPAQTVSRICHLKLRRILRPAYWWRGAGTMLLSCRRTRTTGGRQLARGNAKPRPMNCAGTFLTIANFTGLAKRYTLRVGFVVLAKTKAETLG